MQKINFIALFFILLTPSLSWSQINPGTMYDDVEDDLSLGGDIFNNFSEDLEASQVLEDERFYRYGRFFSVNIGAGVTRFTGNRGRAYQENQDPSFSLSVTYFFDFLNAFTLGIDYSKHTMFIDTYVNAYKTDILGAVDVAMLRPFFGLKFYMDTAQHGNAITYSNPHLLVRLEYWYQTNKFPERKDVQRQSGGGIGTAIGAGLEFPIELKKSYLGVEFLWHWVNFFDKYTQDYRAVTSGTNQSDPNIATFEDLTGNSWTLMFSYNITW
jgi:hypothetical protein